VLLNSLADIQLHIEDIVEDLPTGFRSGLQQLRKKLKAAGILVNQVDSSSLLQVQIKSGPLLLSPDVISDIESLGVSMTRRAPGRELSMQNLSLLIGLVRRHVSLVSEPGCRILMNVILLRVVSAMSTDETDVNIIPDFTLEPDIYPDFAFDGVVDIILTKLQSRLTRSLLFDPTSALENPEAIDRPMISSFLLARQDNVRDTIPRAVLTVAKQCKQYGIPVLRGCVTSGEQWIFFCLCSE